MRSRGLWTAGTGPLADRSEQELQSIRLETFSPGTLGCIVHVVGIHREMQGHARYIGHVERNLGAGSDDGEPNPNKNRTWKLEWRGW